MARLKTATGIGTQAAISSAISYLNRKARQGTGGLFIDTLIRGKVWAYYPADEKGSPDKEEPLGEEIPAKRVVRRLADKLADSELDKKWREAEIIGVPQTDPEQIVVVRVLGTLRETGEVLVVRGDDEPGVWALRKLG